MILETGRKLTPEEQLLVWKSMDTFSDELCCRARKDFLCLQRAEEVANQTEAYREAVKDLTPEQIEAIENYIAACEEFEYAHIFVAYQMGRDHQRLGISGPILTKDASEPSV